MNSKNMDEIKKYCKNNDVDLNEELIGSLTNLKSINEKLFPLLKLESWLAKKLLWCYWLFERDLSSFSEREDINFEEIVYCLTLIANQGAYERMKQMHQACMNDTIRHDRNALNLIGRQDSWEKMGQMRLACMNDAIRHDKELLELIAIQDSLECMREVRLACEFDGLRQDRELLYLIASRETWQEMQLIWQYHIDGLSTDQIKEIFKNVPSKIDTIRARLEQELLELLKIREINALQGETIISR